MFWPWVWLWACYHTGGPYSLYISAILFTIALRSNPAEAPSDNVHMKPQTAVNSVTTVVRVVGSQTYLFFSVVLQSVQYKVRYVFATTTSIYACCFLVKICLKFRFFLLFWKTFAKLFRFASDRSCVICIYYISYSLWLHHLSTTHVRVVWNGEYLLFNCIFTIYL
jgi:hypothetical protein